MVRESSNLPQMVTFRAWALILVFLVVGCRASRVPITGQYEGKESPKAPPITVNSVGRAHIEGPGDTDAYGGTCFLLKGGKGSLLVGAYHVLKRVRPESKLTLVSQIPELALPRGGPLDIAYQGTSSYVQPVEECYARGDLAAFRTDKVAQKAEVLEAAATDAKIGEPVWVVELNGRNGRVTGHKLVQGVVAYHSNYSLVIRMKKVTTVQATSGAPVVNAKGEVVGINVGYFQNEKGYFRIACPGESVRRLVE